MGKSMCNLGNSSIKNIKYSDELYSDFLENISSVREASITKNNVKLDSVQIQPDSPPPLDSLDQHFLTDRISI